MQNSQFVAFKKKSLYEQTKSLFEFISVWKISLHMTLYAYVNSKRMTEE